MVPMAAKGKHKSNDATRINNRRALHEYTITAKLECGIVLAGSEVKALREGKATLQESFARVEPDNQLTLYGLHIDLYDKANLRNHEPLRARRLLAHKREIKKLADETREKGTALIPLAIYFKDGRAKVEIAVGHGRKHHDKRDAIRKREMDRELHKATSVRRQR
jgi:SsrA-binding protein